MPFSLFRHYHFDIAMLLFRHADAAAISPMLSSIFIAAFIIFAELTAAARLMPFDAMMPRHYYFDASDALR
jgi:hypothetical protein